MKIKHLEEVNMSYWQHLTTSLKIAIVITLHGMFPWWLKEYAEKLLKR